MYANFITGTCNLCSLRALFPWTSKTYVSAYSSAQLWRLFPSASPGPKSPPHCLLHALLYLHRTASLSLNRLPLLQANSPHRIYFYRLTPLLSLSSRVCILPHPGSHNSKGILHYSLFRHESTRFYTHCSCSFYC